MKGHHIRYSDAELRWLKANCTMVVGDWHRTFCAKFKRTDISVDNLKALRSRRKWKTGRTGC
ncbi:MAG: HNH endonuclease, partial [Novosphingobium meiothermophilum]